MRKSMAHVNDWVARHYGWSQRNLYEIRAHGTGRALLQADMLSVDEAVA